MKCRLSRNKLQTERHLLYAHTTRRFIPNANRLRPLVIFFNTGNQAGEGTGGDVTLAESLEVDQFDALP